MPVWAESDTVDGIYGMSPQGLTDPLAGGNAPKNHSLVVAGRQHGSIWTKGYVGDGTAIEWRMHQPVKYLPGRAIQQENGSSIVTCCQSTTISIENDRSQLRLRTIIFNAD